MKRDIKFIISSLADFEVEDDDLGKADFEESKHPRDGDGKFTSKESGGTAASLESIKTEFFDSLYDKGDLTPGEEELGNVISLEDDFYHTHYVVEDGELKSGIAWHEDENYVYINHFGSVEPGYGRQTLEHVLQLAQDKGKGIAGQSTPEAEGFYKHFGFDLDEDGNFDIPPTNKDAKRNISAKDEDAVDYTEFDSYKLASRYIQRWVGGVDPDARDTAYSIIKGDPELCSVMLKELLGKDIPEHVDLYRVGNLYEDGINSFFANKQQADSYARRMGVDTPKKYSVHSSAIVPSGAGSGEVWVDANDMWKLSKAEFEESEHPRDEEFKNKIFEV